MILRIKIYGQLNINMMKIFLVESKCREHINGISFEMDCDEYEMKYAGSKYLLRQLDPITENDFEDQL